jgi:CBS domain-containing protein
MTIPPFLQDALSMFSQRIKHVMDTQKVVTASVETPVIEAARLMAMRQVSAILVLENERLVGIFTERDAVFRVMAKGLDPQSIHLRDAMTPSPLTVTPEKTFGHALMLMYENGFRHVPVVVEGKPVGMVNSRNALDPDMEEFVSEERRRNSFK